ncbi:MAG: DnaD domain protein [Lachnospiraceae bacterium]|nr:DnaD domain protein [Lachnospiraceae bacterium]
MDNLVVSCTRPGFTNVSDTFIDEILGSLNESQVKIYLYLLRSVQGNIEISMTSIEDKFNYSEKDVMRAFKYLEKNRLIKMDTDDSKNIKRLSLLEPLSGEDGYKTGMDNGMNDGIRKKTFSPDELASFKARPEICELLYVSETYLKRMLNEKDVSSILYMNSVLGFSPDLIEYLIEYCANNKKDKMSYIDKVALSWAEAGIKTVGEARQRTSDIPAETGEVLKAFGITGRKPADPETAFVKKWLNEYGFSLDIIKSACERTIMNIHEPGFEYADAILLNWKKSGVTSLSDIEKLDELRKQEKEKKKGQGSKTASEKKTGTSGKRGRKKNTDTDYDALVKELLD